MPPPDAAPQADPDRADVPPEADAGAPWQPNWPNWPDWPDWQQAWQEALFGAAGFYRRPEGPAGHFRTATHAAPDVLAGAVIRLAAEHGLRAVVDIGAGRGELLRAVARHATTGLTLHGVDIVARPAGLEPEIGWSAGVSALPPGTLTGALVVAWELLDTVACPVLETDESGQLRRVEVDPRTGHERLGPPVEHCPWQERWWPLPSSPGSHPPPGTRVEVGSARDELWAELVARAAADGGAVLLGVDYAHLLHDRPPQGSLTGYARGRVVAPVPDGSCDLTAEVAIDAVAAAGEAAGATTLALTTQRQGLHSLGITGRLTPGDPVTAHALARVSAEAELIDPHGLGGFSWLLQRV